MPHVSPPQHLFQEPRIYTLPKSGHEVMSGYCLRCGLVHSVIANQPKPLEVETVTHRGLDPHDLEHLERVEAEIRSRCGPVERPARPEKVLDDAELLAAIRRFSPVDWELAEGPARALAR